MLTQKNFPNFSLKRHSWGLWIGLYFAIPFLLTYIAAIVGIGIKQIGIEYFYAISLFLLPTLISIILVACHWAKEPLNPRLHQSCIRNALFGLAWTAPFWASILFGMRFIDPKESLTLQGKSDMWIYAQSWLAVSILFVIIERVISIKKRKFCNSPSA